MLNVNDIYNFCQYEINKNQSGGVLSPTEFNLCLAWSNLEYFKQRVGLPENYVAGKPLPKISLDITQKIMDDMRVFRTSLGGKNRPAMSISIDGWADYPPDYVHVSSIRYNDQTVEILRDDYVASRLSNSIKYPSKENPICVLYDDYIQFYPKDLSFVDFNYMRLPVTPVWGYTIVNDQPVYNPATSTQYEWSQDCLPDLAALILNYAAQNLRDNLIIQTSENRKDSGI